MHLFVLKKEITYNRNKGVKVMIRKSSTMIQNLYIFLILLIAVWTQVAFLQNGELYFTVLMSTGVAVGFFTFFGKKVVPAIILATLIGTVIADVFWNKNPYNEAFLMTLPMIFINLVTPLLFCFTKYLLRYNTITKSNTMLLHIINILTTSIIISIIPAGQIIITNDVSFFTSMNSVVRPTFVGLFVFTTPIILSNYNDTHLSFSTNRNIYHLLYAALFSFVTFGIFGSSSSLYTFTSLGAIFIVLFLLVTFLFNYRMLIFISYMYVTIYNVVYFRIQSLLTETVSINSLNLYLIILVGLTIFTKILIDNNKKVMLEIEKTNKRYKNMFDSVFQLFNISNVLSFEDESFQETYIKNIFEISHKIFNNINHGTCFMYGDTELKVIAANGYDVEFIRSMHLKNNTFDWNAKEPVLIKDTKSLFKEVLGARFRIFEKDFKDITETVGILIKIGTDVNGLITFDYLRHEEKSFSEADLENIKSFQNLVNSFYDMNELALRNSILKDDIVISLVRTLELYDQYTGGHSEDVANLAKMIAEEMDIDTTTQYDVYWAGIVHDIGKIGIDSSIINKETKLTNIEYKEVMKHSLYGYDILQRATDLKRIALLVKHHHEWYNGSGYPDGLKTDEIPFGSQILQVADSVSSMATRRSYQQEKSFDEIIEELDMYNGVQFNPEISEVMVKLIQQGKVQKYFKSKDKYKKEKI